MVKKSTISLFLAVTFFFVSGVQASFGPAAVDHELSAIGHETNAAKHASDAATAASKTADMHNTLSTLAASDPCFTPFVAPALTHSQNAQNASNSSATASTNTATHSSDASYYSSLVAHFESPPYWPCHPIAYANLVLTSSSDTGAKNDASAAKAAMFDALDAQLDASNNLAAALAACP